MMLDTSVGVQIDSMLLSNYFTALVNRFFKILPIREQESESLSVYIDSLQKELLGCKSLINVIDNDPSYLTLLSILQHFIDNPQCPVKEVRREVFRAISVCNKLQNKYSIKEGE